MEDAAAIFSTYAQDPEVARFVSWSVHPSVDVTRKFVEEDCVAGWKTGQVFPWLITLAAGGDGPGVIRPPPGGTRAANGYRPPPRPRGGRPPPRAGRAPVRWGLAGRGISQGRAVADHRNTLS